MTGNVRRRLAPWMTAALLACGDGEVAWNHPTPVIDLPEGFDAVSSLAAKAPVAFPGRPVEVSIAWELHRGGDVSQIVLTRYPGSTRPEDVWAAVSSLRSGNRAWILEGPGTRQVAGRPAWDWTASVPSPQGTLWAVNRTLVVAYPDSTWVASFWGQHPEWQDADRQDEVLASFRVPVPARPVPKAPIVVVLVLAAVAGLVSWRKRPKREAARPMRAPKEVFTGQTLPADQAMDPMVHPR